MTDADWLSGKDPDRMLAAVVDRLSDRQLHLLACGLARRVWDALPEGDLRAALEWCELHAGTAHSDPAADDWLTKLEAAIDPTREWAREVQREIVKTADPDADPDSFQHADARRTNPSAPLFQAACRYAGNSVEQAADGAAQAAQVVAALLDGPPGEGQIATVRMMVLEASRVRAAANLDASSALKMKAAGDAAADVDPRKKVNIRYAAALQTVTEEEESAGTRRGEVEEQKENADRKATARLLHEIAGNPFRPFRFEPAWLTESVVGVARAVYAGRAFDRMPILADALLDADCDEEAVLRHCRGTEAHTDGPAHARGCWVVDLILGHEPAYFAAPVLLPPPPAALPPRPAPPAGGLGGMERLLRAIQKADDGDEEE